MNFCSYLKIIVCSRNNLVVLGFHLRPEAGRFIRSFFILCPALCFRDFALFYYEFTDQRITGHNRILQLNSSKLLHYFFLSSGKLDLFPSFIPTKLKIKL